MSNEISKITPADIMNIGEAFAKSGMFADVKNAAQAIVKIHAGQELGLPPFASMSGIHIIQGKPTIGAGLIASCVKGSGKYDYRVMEQTEKICSIDFYQGKEKIGNSTFTIDDAKKAGTKNLDKFPKNMLFARAISNGVKWFTPDVFSGPVYVPEEMLAVVEDVPHEVVEVDQDELQQCINNLALCSTVDELKALKKVTPEKIQAEQSFISAAKSKYSEIIAPATN